MTRESVHPILSLPFRLLKESLLSHPAGSQFLSISLYLSFPTHQMRPYAPSLVPRSGSQNLSDFILTKTSIK